MAEHDIINFEGRQEFDGDGRTVPTPKFVEVAVRAGSMGSGASIFINGINTGKTSPDTLYFSLDQLTTVVIKLQLPNVKFPYHFELVRYGNGAKLYRVDGEERTDVTLEDRQQQFIAQFDGQKTTEPPEPTIDDTDCVEYKVQGLTPVMIGIDELDPLRQPWVEIRYENCGGEIIQRRVEGVEIIDAKIHTVEIVDGRGSIELITQITDTDDDVEKAALTVIVKGVKRGIVIVNNDDVTNLKEGRNNLVYPLETELQIKSSDLTQTRIAWVRVFAPNQEPQDLRANTGESLEVKFEAQNKVIIEVNAEEVVIQHDIPTIQLDHTGEVAINLLDDDPLLLNILTDKTDVVSTFVKDEKFDTVVSYYDQEMGTISSTIEIPQSVFSSLGQYKLILVPSNQFGAGEPLEVIVNAINEYRIPKPDLRNIRYPSKIKGPDFVGTDVDFSITWDADDKIDFVRIYFGDYYGNTEFIETTDRRIRLNVKDVLSKTSDAIVDGKTHTFLIRMIPFSDQGIRRVAGFEERLAIEFTEGDLSIPREEAINRIFDVFQSQLETTVFAQSTSNLLTHFLHLGDGDNKLISNWVGSEESLVVKLYEPLPVTVQTNQQVWISKIQSNPIIETVTLTGRDESHYPELRGPNFSLEPHGATGYKVYEDLLNTDVDGSYKLVNEFTKGVGIDTQKLDIQYVADPYANLTDFEYTFDQFVHFGSAEERVKNYKFKLQFIEDYEDEYEKLTSGSADYIGTVTANQQAEQKRSLINKTIQNFDGFEKFLQETEHNLDNEGDWYGNLLQQAVDYDVINVDYLVNNIPKHILKDRNNADFFLFLDMIGHHFDILWVYINGITRIKKLEEKQTKGIANKLVYHLLESFGWNSRKAYETEQLWQYAFGLKSDGSQYENTYQNASNEVWRRILNNLPYLLKHKGTARSMKAIMSSYGVPSSLLTIMEFGGPKVRDNETKQFTYEDITAALNFQFGNDVEILWDEYAITSLYPQAVELRINTQYRQPQTVVFNDTNWRLDIVPTTAEMGTLNLFVSGGGVLYSASTPQFPIFDNEYNQILINKSGSQFDIYGVQADAGRVQQIVSASINIADNDWASGSVLTLGDQFSGSIDEFRIWTVALNLDKLQNHALFPDAIDGNGIFSSTEDLIFRLNFEEPQPLFADPIIDSVSINRAYAEEASANGFSDIEDYPYQYTPYERTVTATVPSYGFTYSDKFRFEDTELIDDLSYKKRATRKSFDKAAIDSNRLGIFLSPNKELNLDVIKSFGDGFRIDDLIGDPSDQYKAEYSGLKSLRSYYFQRLNRNINEYIQLVKYIDRSLFDVLADLAPARVKVSKGLLIEPHILERSKIKWSKPQGEYSTENVVIDATQSINIELWTQILDTILSVEDATTLTAIKTSWDAVIEADDVIDLNAEAPNYPALISVGDIMILESTYLTFEAGVEFIITGEAEQGENEAIPFTHVPITHKTTNNIPFSNYFVNGYFKSSQKAFLVKRERIVNVVSTFSGKEISGFATGHTEVYPVTEIIYEVSLIPFGIDPTTGLPELSKWNLMYTDFGNIVTGSNDPGFYFQNTNTGVVVDIGNKTSFEDDINMASIDQADLDSGLYMQLSLFMDVNNIGTVPTSQTGYLGAGIASTFNTAPDPLKYWAIETDNYEVYYFSDPSFGISYIDFYADEGADEFLFSHYSEPNTGDSGVSLETYKAHLSEYVRFMNDWMDDKFTSIRVYYLTESDAIALGLNPTFPTGSDIVSAEPLDGYYRTHYRYTSGTRHWTALQNLYYLGCKQTDDTTPDGLPAVQSFTTNPNILRVADTGRGSGEPILTVD